MQKNRLFCGTDLEINTCLTSETSLKFIFHVLLYALCHVLFYFNTQVLEILQRANVNIASMNVARSIVVASTGAGTAGAEGMSTRTKLYFCFLCRLC